MLRIATISQRRTVADMSENNPCRNDRPTREPDKCSAIAHDVAHEMEGQSPVHCVEGHVSPRVLPKDTGNQDPTEDLGEDASPGDTWLPNLPDGYVPV